MCLAKRSDLCILSVYKNPHLFSITSLNLLFLPKFTLSFMSCMSSWLVQFFQKGSIKMGGFHPHIRYKRSLMKCTVVASSYNGRPTPPPPLPLGFSHAPILILPLQDGPVPPTLIFSFLATRGRGFFWVILLPIWTGWGGWCGLCWGANI